MPNLPCCTKRQTRLIRVNTAKATAAAKKASQGKRATAKKASGRKHPAVKKAPSCRACG
jgi:hypothetical protein